MSVFNTPFKILTIALLLLAWLSPSAAQKLREGESPLAVKLEAFSVSADGKSTPMAAESVRPGDVVEYRTTYTNNGVAPLAQVQALLPVPSHMRLVQGSPSPAAFEASLDGVKFARLPLRREARGADGKTVMVDVPLAEVRYLRWQIGSLSPGGTREFRMRAVVAGSG